jgi:arabinofuranan 3-O-arabinosyltransferase
VPELADADAARSPQSVERLRMAAVSLALVLMTFAQNSGSVAADTKLDLIVDPARFLRRALTLWDPNGSAGQLQDQAYGYLFPMGPFFVLGKLSGLPPWVTQRLWESCLLVVAFLGVVRLARLLGNDRFWPRVAAGLVYALAPRMLTELFSISSELLPVAVLPWVLIPLVRGAQAGSVRRVAGLSGIALLFAGGINASATLAILPVPALWLLTRSRGPRRAALIRWWAIAVILASLWWVLPLMVLGKYSPPFLDWIESSAVTTSQNSLLAVLRGVDHWQAYLGPTVWPGGWVFVVTPAAILATTAVAAAGLAGLIQSNNPNRGFLLTSLGIGLILMTLGHVSSVGPPFDLAMRTFLDGAGNAFRNVHKFDPLVRLPLAIGVGQLLASRVIPSGLRMPFRPQVQLLRPRLLGVFAVLTVGAMALGPAFGGRLVPQPRGLADGPWWNQAATWLAQNADGGRAIIVPGAGRPNMVWGQTVDDPMQPVATTPWTVRDALPLAQPGYIRLLDGLDQIFARGQRSSTLELLLARAGIKYVVVRNDLDSSVAGATRLGYVHTTLVESPGFSPVSRFGPDFGEIGGPDQFTDGGTWGNRPAVEIFQVASYDGAVGLLPAEQVQFATGSADSLPQLVERGIGIHGPVIFGQDAGTAASPSATTVATDGIRRREAVFGQPGQNAATLTADAPFAAARAAHDYLPSDAGPLSVMSYRGISDVRASSSGADVAAALNRGASNAPFSALDGSPDSAWLSGSFGGAVGQWFAVDFEAPTAPENVRIAFAPNLGDYPSRVRVETDAGVLESDVASDAKPQPLTVPTGTTRGLRVTVTRMLSGTPGTSVGISELSIPRIDATRTLTVPVIGSPGVLAFDTAAGYRAECLTVAGAASCDPTNRSAGEEDAALDRTFTLTEPRSYHVAATVRLVGSKALDTALDRALPMTARVSSRETSDPRQRPGAAIDGNPATTWTAATGDQIPTLTIALGTPKLLRGLEISTASSAPVSRPSKVEVRAGDETWTGTLGDDSTVNFARPVRADVVTIRVLSAQPRVTTDSQTFASRILPVGISDVTLRGSAIPRPIKPEPVNIGCDAGLVLQVDGQQIPLHVQATPADALAGQPVLATPCGSDLIELGAGSHRMRLAGAAVAAPVSLTGTASDRNVTAATPDSAGSVAAVKWGATKRQVQVTTTAASFLVVRENANAGWVASLNGKQLSSVTLDGWEQGYLIPAGVNGQITLTFEPQNPFALGLAAGVACAVGLAVMCIWPARRRVGSEGRALGPGRIGWATRTVALGILGFGLLGVPGLVLAAALAVASRFATPTNRLRVRILPILCLAFAGVLVALFPPGATHSLTNGWFVQLLCGAAVLGAVVASWPLDDVRRLPNLSSRRSMPNQDSAATAVVAAPVSTNSSTK